MKKYLALVLVLLTSCSEQANINGLIAGEVNRKSIFHLLERAQYFFDQGEFDVALDYANEAYKDEPSSEDVAAMLGYIHLAIAGIDSFKLISKLSSANTPTPTPESAPTENAPDNVASTLGKFADILGIDAAEEGILTLPGNRSGLIEGAPTEGPFKDLPVLLPKSATEARNSEAITVHNLFLAVSYICPFVVNDVKILGEDGDIRHTADMCAPYDVRVKNSTKLLYLWASAHLIEAVVFHRIVLYQPSGADPNLVLRSKALSATADLGLAQYVAAVGNLAATIQIILPTEKEAAKESMLTAIFNDLEAASRGFSRIPGIPASVTTSISTVLVKLKEQQSGLGTKTGSSSDALKEELTKGLTENLKEQILEKDTKGELSPEQKAEVCAAYKTISSAEFATCAGG